jgi:hypothetical protein
VTRGSVRLGTAGRRAFALSTILAMTAVAVALAPSAASAQPGVAVTSAPRVELGMHLVGFDAPTAEAHGYAVVTLPDGSLASVPATKADAARAGSYRPQSGILRTGQPVSGSGVTPDGFGSIGGDCGRSWVSLEGIGGNAATLITGMNTVADAGDPWDVSWHVDIDDTGGHSTQNYSEEDGFNGPLYWTSYARRLGLSPGWAAATVTWGSFIITDAGWICFSYSPTTTTTIY